MNSVDIIKKERMKKILYFILIALATTSCGEEELKYIYHSQVHFTVDTRNQDNVLNAPMQAKSFTTPRLSSDRMGFGGILVICSASHITGTVYNLFAYDLACPYEQNPQIKVIPDKNGKAKCPKCESVYDIFNGIGNPVSGPSKTNLEVYRNIRHNNSSPGVFVIDR